MSNQRPWWELIPPNTIIGKISNVDKGSQAAIGRDISQSIVNQLGIPTPEDIDSVREEMKRLNIEIQQLDITEKQKGQAELQLQQIEEMLSSPQAKGDVSALKRAVEWIVAKLPQVGKLLRTVFMLSSVGRILAQYGDDVLVWAKQIFEHLSMP